MNPLLVKDEGEEEGLNPFEVFPEEVWIKILGDVTLDPRDLISVSRTCWPLNDMVEEKRLEWVPPIRMVLPFIMKYLTKAEIYALRLASRRISQDVDKWLVAHPHQRIYNSSNYRFVNRQLGKVLRCHDYCIQDQVEELISKMRENFSPGRNPFLGRSLWIKLRDKWERKIHHAFIQNVIHQVLPCPLVRDHIWHVRIGLDDMMFQYGKLLLSLLRKIFLCVKNIRTVFVDLRCGCYIYPVEEEEFWRESMNNPLPSLRHSLPLSVKYAVDTDPTRRINPLIKLVVVNRYYPQLVKIELDLAHSDKYLREYRCRYLKSLELTGVTLRDLVQLKRFDAPMLEELKLNFSNPSEDADPSRRFFSFKIAAVVLRRFPKLRVLILYGINELVQVCSCLWDREARTCYPDPKLSPAGRRAVEKHDWDHHEKVMWLLLPTVNEIWLNYTKLVRPPKKMSRLDWN